MDFSVANAVSVRLLWTPRFKSRLWLLRHKAMNSHIGKWLSALRTSKEAGESQNDDWPPKSAPDTFGYFTRAKPRQVKPDLDLAKEVETLLRNSSVIEDRGHLMWKLPFHVLGVESYSDQIFDSAEECLEKHCDSIKSAMRQVEEKRMKVGRLLIFKHQAVALPPPEFDQRVLGVGDQPGVKWDEDRPRILSFGESNGLVCD